MNVAEPEVKKGRARDARRAREVILDAAEAVFAEHGFDGARIDAIAKASSYNTSLLFQYFGDKVGLYSAVLQRFDKELNSLSASTLAPWLAEDALVGQRSGFRVFIEALVQTTFDYLIEHPHFQRMLAWEMAEGWQTYLQIAPQFMEAESDPFEKLFAQARRAGWLRSDFSAVIQMTLVFQACQSYLAFLPMYEKLFPGQAMSSAAALSRARESLVRWVAGAMMVDLPEAQAARSETGATV